MGETRTEVDEFEDRDPGDEMTVAMIQGEPAVVCRRERDVEAALPVATSWSVAEAAGFYPDTHAGSAEELDQL